MCLQTILQIDFKEYTLKLYSMLIGESFSYRKRRRTYSRLLLKLSYKSLNVFLYINTYIHTHIQSHKHTSTICAFTFRVLAVCLQLSA